MSETKGLEIHEVANIFPAMTDEEYRDLKADIGANGLREPVWVHEGRVIDGRNRLRACMELGIEPEVREWAGGGSLVAFVFSLNLHRRHLTASQRAALAADIEPLIAVEVAAEKARKAQEQVAGQVRDRLGNFQANGRIPLFVGESGSKRKSKTGKEKSEKKERESGAQAAKVAGVSRPYAQAAKAIKAKSPELHEQVKAGKVTVTQAKRQLARDERRAELEAKAAAAPPADPAEQAWEVAEGDCLDVLRDLPPGSARLIFADPPYNIGIDYGDGEQADRLPPEQYLGWCRDWIAACADLLAPDGSLWVLIGHEWADEFGCMLRRAGLHRRAWLIWYESFGVNCANNFNRCSRHLFHMVKDPRRCIFHPAAVNRPSDRQAIYNDSRADPAGKIWDDVWGIKPPIPRVVGTSKERIDGFPTQLPLDLLRPIVGCASEPGDLVIDPFSGSATTGVAAVELGRRYLGVERSAEFARLSRLRLSAAASEPSHVAHERFA